jgi:hypothetical protein
LRKLDPILSHSAGFTNSVGTLYGREDIRLIIKMDGKLFESKCYFFRNCSLTYLLDIPAIRLYTGRERRYKVVYKFGMFILVRFRCRSHIIEQMLHYEKSRVTYELVVWNALRFSSILTPTDITVLPPVRIDKKIRNYYRDLIGGGVITMGDGSKRLVRMINVGDEVMTLDENNQQTKTRGQCVRVDRVHALTECARIGSTWLPAGHPVRQDSFGKRVWRRPSSLATTCFIIIESLYNFVVESRSSIFVNNLEISTLGQLCPGLDDVSDEIYLGSELVVQESFNAAIKEGKVPLPTATVENSTCLLM